MNNHFRSKSKFQCSQEHVAWKDTSVLNEFLITLSVSRTMTFWKIKFHVKWKSKDDDVSFLGHGKRHERDWIAVSFVIVDFLLLLPHFDHCYVFDPTNIWKTSPSSVYSSIFRLRFFFSVHSSVDLLSIHELHKRFHTSINWLRVSLLILLSYHVSMTESIRRSLDFHESRRRDRSEESCLIELCSRVFLLDWLVQCIPGESSIDISVTLQNPILIQATSSYERNWLHGPASAGVVVLWTDDTLDFVNWHWKHCMCPEERSLSTIRDMSFPRYLYENWIR